MNFIHDSLWRCFLFFLVILCVFLLPIRRVVRLMTNSLLHEQNWISCISYVYDSNKLLVAWKKNSQTNPFSTFHNYDLEMFLPFFIDDNLPQLFLVLGGDPIREKMAIDYFSQNFHRFEHNASLFLSSGALSFEDIVNHFGTFKHQLIVRNDAVDTLSNFTKTLCFLKQHGIKYITIATSSHHMPRALAIGTVILGSENIKFSHVALDHKPFYPSYESRWHTRRDIIRAWIWVFTNVDGSTFVQYFK
jgi:hypothetical protein